MTIASKESIMKDLQIALILSSDPDIRERISNLLMKIDISLILESDRHKALERILHVDLKLVFVDIEPEDTEAVDFIRLIKKVRPRVSVIALTYESAEEEQEKYLKAGAMYCFVKPVEEETILAKTGIGLVNNDREI
jgi:DNA-binding response OmpR family regulator